MNSVETIATEAANNTGVEPIPFNKLVKGSRNVRTVRPEKHVDAQLVSNIRAKGVLQNLVVEPSTSAKGFFEVIAGGRRWSSVGVLVKAGDFPEDYPMPCKIQYEGSAAETSLSENLRAPMHISDEYEAFATMRKDGLSDDDIADHFGITKKYVAQRMKLGEVHPQITKSFRRGDIDLETVIAFTLADTKAQQLSIFKELGSQCVDWRVRKAITNDGESTDGKLAQFVTLESYKEAGGQVVSDLFGERQYLPDVALLRELAEAKLQKSAERLKQRERWSNVEVCVSKPQDIYSYHRVTQEPVNPPAELLASLQTVVAQQDTLQESDGEWTEEQEQAYEATENELEALEKQLDKYRQYSDEDKARAKCVVTVGHNGKVAIERGLVSQAQRRATERAAQQSNPDSGEHTAAALPNALMNDLGEQRQQIAKAKLATSVALASDVLLYTLCDQMLSPIRHYDRAIEASFTCVMPDGEHVAETPAAALLEKAKAALLTEWLDIESPAERFAALRQIKPKAKQALLAYCVAECFMLSLAKPGSCGIDEAILADLAPDVIALWRPSGENYFRRLTTPVLLAQGKEWFGDAWYVTHQKDKKKDLVAFFDAFFNGDAAANLTDEQRDIRASWLPPGFVAV